jgi:hypothetical protein
MRRVIATIAATICLALAASAECSAADPVYDITVVADKTKANGSPWDGVPGLGNTKLNLNAAPDIAVCLVRAQGKPECLWKPDGRRLFSICQNAWTCKFPNVALQPLPIGLVFIDIDVRNHDIIDTLILTDKVDEAANEDIADSLRAAMTFLTPNRSEDAKEHTVRNAKVLPLQDCVGDKPCRLTQSQFTLVRRP